MNVNSNYGMMMPPPPPVQGGGSQQQQTLNSEDQELVSSLLEAFDASSLNSEDAQSIVEAFKEAGIEPGQALGNAIKEAGFDPEEIKTLAEEEQSSQNSIGSNPFMSYQALNIYA